MPDVTESFLRDQLLVRRERLESSVRVVGPHRHIENLLNEVDAALARMDAGSYGTCETCHDPVEKDRLLADPLVRLCLDHLTAQQRQSLEQDLDLARQLQQGLLPAANLQSSGWSVSYHYQPLGIVSGDYCDLVVRENGSTNLFFALGDVSGKGVAAAILMSQLHAIFRTLAAANLPTQTLVERASRVFCETTMSTFFATLICGRADAAGGMELCNAGHCAALLSQQGKVTRLEATGVPMGMFCDGLYSTCQVRLAPGESLLLYTDGVSEARSPAGEEYGEERLETLLAQESQAPPPALIRACLDALNAFRSGQPLLDDLTIMAIQRAC